ncbi:hypothetical protein QJS10_CPA06g01554 [Acorus calamus]|uniref:Uncharacterized protein n=1 Tax=Acorus calamus TaxID=4465 RepID=A0AAV9EM50_ACOCL|nr:hypothetical protein QJS10_CPA06g01554 [Acorus calamus]
MAGLRGFVVAVVIFLAVMGPTLSSAEPYCYIDCLSRCRRRHTFWTCSVDCFNYCLTQANAYTISKAEESSNGGTLAVAEEAAP